MAKHKVHPMTKHVLQVASKEFFLKTLPLFDGGDDVGMVLSPQCFHNLNLHSDIFNHSNVHFWEYMQPGYDALGFISCTGTNFLVSSTTSQAAINEGACLMKLDERFTTLQGPMRRLLHEDCQDKGEKEKETE